MNPLQARLAALRRRLRLVVSFRGVCWLVATVGLIALLAGGLDWLIHLPALVRAVILTAALAAGCSIAYRLLIRPLSTPADDLSLALRIESLFPSLNDSLASAVQFLEHSDVAPDGSETSSTSKPRPPASGLQPPACGSASLRREAVRQALRRTKDCDFNRAVPLRGIWTAGMSLAVVSALLLFLISYNPLLAWTALERLAVPFGDRDWPCQTRLDLENKLQDRIARGSPYEIRGRLGGVIPDAAVVVFEGISPPRQRCLVRQESKTTGSLLLRLDQAERDFRFQVQANDAVSEWHRVVVQPPPSLVPLEGRPSPQVHLRYPAYTDLPAQNLPDGVGNFEAVVGTHVTLRAAADRPLSRAWIEYRPEQPAVPNAAFVGILGAQDSLSALALTAAGQEIWERIPVSLDATGRILTAKFLPRVRGMYALCFEDESGLGATRLFDLRLWPDPAPTVHLDRPSLSQDNLQLLPGAEFTVQVRAEDMQFALRSVSLEYRCQKDDPPRRLPLYDHHSMGTALSHLLSVLAGPSAPASLTLQARMLPTPPARLRLQRMPMNVRTSLDRFRHLDGRPLQEGDILTLWVCADDFDDVAVDKQPGRSPEVEIQIVGRQALEEKLNQDQTRIQEELLRLRKMQEEALRQVIGAEQRKRNTGALRPQDIDQLFQAEQIQQQIRARVGTEKEGLRADAARILRNLRDNRLARSGIQDRMERVASELERLAQQELEQIEPRLTQARKENETSKETRPAGSEDQDHLGAARRHQEEVEKTLNELLRLLEPWGNVHAVKGEARSILQEQRKLQEEVAGMDKEEVRGREREALTPEQRAAADRAAELQRKLEERTEQLLGKMQRLGAEHREKDPETAQALREAAEKGREGTLSEKMKNAGRNIRENKLGEARADQQSAVQALEAVVRSLEERREQELDRLRKKLKESDDKLKDLTRKQSELRKKIQEAGRIPDRKKREHELKRLALEQEELRRQAQELERELKFLRPDVAQALEDAAGPMEEAVRKLQQGDDPEEETEESLERLQDAQREVKEVQKEIEQELVREKLAKVADQIKLLKERQESAVAEMARIQEKAVQRKTWDRVQLTNLGEQARVQKGLAEETDALAKDKLAPAKVFARLLARAAEDMEQSAQRIAEYRDKARERPEEMAADTEIARLQNQAIRRLDQLLNVLNPEKDVARRPAGGDGGTGGGRSGRTDDGISWIAQLKVLRDLQQEVNERTEAFGRKHPDLDKLTPEEQSQLQALRKEQQELADLIEELMMPPEGEK